MGIFGKHFGNGRKTVKAPPSDERAQLFDCACGQRVFMLFEIDGVEVGRGTDAGAWRVVEHDKPDETPCTFELPPGIVGVGLCKQCDRIVYQLGNYNAPTLAPHVAPCGLPCAGAPKTTAAHDVNKLHKRTLGGCVRCDGERCPSCEKRLHRQPNGQLPAHEAACGKPCASGEGADLHVAHVRGRCVDCLFVKP